jgi:hypothetical protein
MRWGVCRPVGTASGRGGGLVVQGHLGLLDQSGAASQVVLVLVYSCVLSMPLMAVALGLLPCLDVSWWSALPPVVKLLLNWAYTALNVQLSTAWVCLCCPDCYGSQRALYWDPVQSKLVLVATYFVISLLLGNGTSDNIITHHSGDGPEDVYTNSLPCAQPKEQHTKCQHTYLCPTKQILPPRGQLQPVQKKPTTRGLHSRDMQCAVTWPSTCLHGHALATPSTCS